MQSFCYISQILSLLYAKISYYFAEYQIYFEYIDLFGLAVN